ncbi:hypothetical protein [Actinophytocola algeriensis]|uniref:Uncharacterized protein n=1 Tax=Actinophytocola algeriensis TaxID=1768010 RepID=A0A7W7Q5B1_9PSEU|nr:hypothetical protein [Actinophytocola algeriensis]MBB4906964.1 hypothetical protein [Actinophytocola algeriensis]MBE1478447.1 hypothetical protein [Actinophytocola algeriensis]
MPRLVFEEPKGGPANTESAEDRRDAKRDNVVVVLKAATFALVIALVGAGILLATAGGEPEQEATAPSVPEIEASNTPTTSTTTPLAEIVAPEVRSQTAVITATAPPTTTQPTPPPGTTRPPGRGDRFAVVGQRCDTPGTYSFTERYQPVVCVERRDDKPVWRLVFE